MEDRMIEVTHPGAVEAPTKRHKEGGSWFDDQPRYNGPTQEQLNSLELRRELNQRVGISMFVNSHDERQEMRKVLQHWLKLKELHHPVDVWVDTTVEPGQVRLRYT